jgi:hypothetical protein
MRHENEKRRRTIYIRKADMARTLSDVGESKSTDDRRDSMNVE